MHWLPQPGDIRSCARGQRPSARGPRRSSRASRDLPRSRRVRGLGPWAPGAERRGSSGRSPPLAPRERGRGQSQEGRSSRSHPGLRASGALGGNRGSGQAAGAPGFGSRRRQLASCSASCAPGHGRVSVPWCCETGRVSGRTCLGSPAGAPVVVTVTSNSLPRRFLKSRPCYLEGWSAESCL